MDGEFLWQFIMEVKNKTKKKKMFQFDSSRSLFTTSNFSCDGKRVAKFVTSGPDGLLVDCPHRMEKQNV